MIKLLKFMSPSCAPCKTLTETLPTITDGLSVEVEEVNVEENFQLARRHAIMGGLPTLVAVDANGDQYDRLVGYHGTAKTRKWIQQL